MKWTPENDQLLLLKILETSNVNADVKVISAAWPTDRGDPPTPRAITERLVVIRKAAKANGGGNFSVASAQAKNPQTPTSSPCKPKKTKKETSPGEKDQKASGKGSTGKRKLNGTSTKIVKQENSNDETDDETEKKKLTSSNNRNQNPNNSGNHSNSDFDTSEMLSIPTLTDGHISKKPKFNDTLPSSFPWFDEQDLSAEGYRMIVGDTNSAGEFLEEI